MTELSAALRQFADRIDRGELLPGASQCAIVLADDAGVVQATYMGKLMPANGAGIHLLAAGIQRFNAGMLAPVAPAGGAAVGGPIFGSSGSTH